jgi:hypothetical protein
VAGWMTGISFAPSPPRPPPAPCELSEEAVTSLLHDDALMMRRARHLLATAPQ